MYGADDDQRTSAQRDRDRVLYCSYFRRLAGVTQVVGPSEGHLFHNRLTHTLEVAQVARRLAEKLMRDDPEQADALGGIDPDVVEAAALAHDLGHPPFGHIAEWELDRLARKVNSDHDGFEGNAQSFRIITRLAPHRDNYLGLNLTRATLNAVLKYPWMRDTKDKGSKKHRKFGAYRIDKEAFEFARIASDDQDKQSVEAAIMDHADAIAYSVHDLADFYSAGLLPLDQLSAGSDEFDRFLSEWSNWEKTSSEISLDEVASSRSGLINLLEALVSSVPRRGAFGDRAALAESTSALIKDFIFAASLNKNNAPAEKVLLVERHHYIEMLFLQGLVEHFVIRNPRLATQQHGQRRVIRTLFNTYLTAVRKRNVNLIPTQFHTELLLIEPGIEVSAEIRLAIDIVASLSDYQATLLYRRLLGVDGGSIADMLVS